MWWLQVAGQAVSSLAPGLGQAVLVGCPPLTAQIKLPALPFTLQGLQLKGSLMGGWPNSLSAIQDLVEGYMEHSQPDIDMLVGKIFRKSHFYLFPANLFFVCRYSFHNTGLCRLLEKSSLRI